MGIHIHIHHHDRATDHKLSKIMATLEQFEQALNRIDTATTDIANDIRQLKDEIANGGLNADNEAAILSRLDATATALEAIGASVENPVPDEPGEENPQG